MNWQSSTENYAECVVDDCTFQIVQIPSGTWMLFMHYANGKSASTAVNRAEADKRCADMLAGKQQRDSEAYADLI